MTRPRSIAEIAGRTLADSGAFDRSVREFLDAWQSMTTAERQASIAGEPAALVPLKDAYLAALAEHLALSERLDAPGWTEQPRRFLTEPFFAGGLESLKATLIAESPSAFRRRLIFISGDGLYRPQRVAEAAG